MKPMSIEKVERILPYHFEEMDIFYPNGLIGPGTKYPFSLWVQKEEDAIV